MEIDWGAVLPSLTVLGTGFGLWRLLMAEIKENRIKIEGVRQASESAHTEIRQELSNIRIEQAAHTERLKCVEDKVDKLSP